MRISDWSSDVCSSDLFAGAGHGILEHPGDEPRALRRRPPGDIDAVDEHLPPLHRDDAGYGIEQRGLAGAVGADDRDELALGYLYVHPAEREPLEGLTAAERDVTVAGRDNSAAS